MTMTNMNYQFSYNLEWEVYQLHPYPQESGETLFTMLVRHCYGEYTYKPIVHIDGEWYEIYTVAELDERCKDIAEHEGDDVAHRWRQEQDQIMIVRNNHFIFKAKEFWEALMKITPLCLDVTWKEFPRKPMNEELRKELDRLRNAYDNISKD